MVTLNPNRPAADLQASAFLFHAFAFIQAVLLHKMSIWKGAEVGLCKRNATKVAPPRPRPAKSGLRFAYPRAAVDTCSYSSRMPIIWSASAGHNCTK
ncbi:uncharacterized protein EI97DRAFT_49011 [Westerdykella ornata]|uniref:Uncharacterized protein n=1 Tax=Westerdykella ornata TaxID=318751 RepID=A0A6A6JK82_WESOR|nr:uncharacterized protein EI97DRAFT_49011 [Westerdykella ornata]KAF2276106.1 hypothetical protein EI97DRAFT_49011 [Westerdykella ornata]